MKRIIVTALIMLLYSGIVFSQDTSATNYELRKVTQTAFKLGEKLTFKIYYGGVKAGEAIMEIAPDYVNFNGRNCYKLNVTARSSSTFEWIYKLNERYECYFDVDGLFPWRYEHHKIQGKYKNDFEAIFDQSKHKVKTFKGENKDEVNEYDIPEYVQDEVSAFFYARTFALSNPKEWDIISSYKVFENDKTKQLDVKYVKTEEVEVDAGKFRAFKVIPYGMEGGLFGGDDQVIIWLTDDDVKMPVKINVKIKVGSFNVELTSYENVNPLNSKLD
jgi:hypothetical protein